VSLLGKRVEQRKGEPGDLVLLCTQELPLLGTMAMHTFISEIGEYWYQYDE